MATEEIDFRTRQSFADAVQTVLAARPAAALLDLTAVTFVSSEGVSALLQATHQASEIGTPTTIMLNPTLRRRLQL